MNFRVTARILALVLLLSVGLSPRAIAFWQCEGRVCGITLSSCCCVAVDGVQDPNCDRLVDGAASSSTCPAECGCVLTLREAGQAATTGSGRSAPQLVPLPSLSAFAAVVPLGGLFLARVEARRGPPRAVLLLSTPGLRAPPAA